MQNLAETNIAKPVRLLREALLAQCQDCTHIVTPGLFWNLSKSMHLHTSGTGHQKFKLYTYSDHENGE
jgi:hypothetical protein